MIKKAFAIGTVLALALVLAGCSGDGVLQGTPEVGSGKAIAVVDASDLSGGVAAKVGDVEIGENAITAYVNNLRYANGLQDDEAWGRWVCADGRTMDSLRSEAIDYFVNRGLVRQAAAKEGVEVSDGDLERALQDAREGMTDDEFADYLDKRGLDEEGYRDELYTRLLEDKLTDKISPSKKMDDEYLLEQVKMYYSNDVAKDATSLDDVDPAIVDNVRQIVETQAGQAAFSDYIGKYRSSVGVTVNAMPEGLPYAIDLEPYIESDKEA